MSKKHLNQNREYILGQKTEDVLLKLEKNQPVRSSLNDCDK